jgi:putative peptidoglycan lipid II flippase
LPRIGLATLVMAFALWAMAAGLAPSLALPSRIGVRFGALGALVGAGLLVYGLAILALGVIDRRQLRGFLRRSGSADAA